MKLSYCRFRHLFIAIVLSLLRYDVVAQIIASPACTAAKEECHNDTDCLHRVMYLHSTCVTRTCQPQCKIAVLNLYETLPGRKLLETDLSCMTGVESEMAQCELIPTRIPMHCSLARLVCEADPLCRNDIDIFESLCHDSDPTELRECSDECGTYLGKVFRKSKGAALRSCTCWKQDPLCNHLKQTLLDKCALKAGSIVDNTNENRTIKKQNEEGGNNKEQSISEPESKAESDSGTDKLAQSAIVSVLSIILHLVYLL